MCSHEALSAFDPTSIPNATTMSPTPNYSTDPGELSFRKALDLIREPWIRAFLLPSQEQYLEQLQQTLMQPLKVTADMSITTLAATEALSLNEHIRFLLLPSFSTGTVSAGYQVTHYVNTNISVYKTPYIARCVRDDINGIFLTVAELPGTGLTEITCCTQHSPGFRDHVFMVLETEKFREAMPSFRDSYDPEKMKAALIYSFQSCEIRQCPSCGQMSVPCTCPLSLVRKKHPMDFDADLYNLRSYMGSYDGVSHQAIYETGVNLYNGTYSTRASVEFTYDNDRRRKLESWAFQDTIKGRNLNLMKLSMPAFETREVRIDYGDEFAPPVNSGAIADGDVIAWSQFSDDADGQAARIEQFLSDKTAPEIFPSELPDLESNFNEVTGTQKGASQTTSSPTEQESQEKGESSSFSDSSYSRNASLDEVDHPAHWISKTKHPQALRVPCVSTTSAIPTHPLYQLSFSQTVKPCFDQDAITRPKRMGRPPAPKIRPLTRLVPIVPATKVTATVGVQKATHTFSEDVRRKVELRKARNRASAVRSNERKKKQMQELKDNLEQAKNRETELRSEERVLRQANLELRAKLSG